MSPTVPPKDEIRHVVIEPKKPTPSRLKQYVTTQDIEINKRNYKAFEYILIPEPDALAYLSSHMLLPLDVAIREGIYPPPSEKASNKLFEKVKEVAEEVTGLDLDRSNETSTDPQTTESKKAFLGNSLREAIQAQKAKIDASKLAAIRAGGTK